MNNAPSEQHAIPSSQKPARLCLIGDALYWKASEDGLTFTYEGESDDDHSTELQKSETAFKMGFRIGLGYRIPRDVWEIKAFVTQLRSYTHWNKNASEESPIHPSFGMRIPQSYDYEEMSESWHIKYTLLDFESARRPRIDKAFGIYPFFGLRAARIDQLIHLNLNEPLNDAPSLKAEGKNDYHAYFGARLGTELDLYLTKYLALFGRGSFTLLLGHFDAHIKINTQSFPEYTLFSNQKHSSDLVPNAELSSGIKGTIPLYRRQAFLTLGINYEMSAWFFQNLLPTLLTASNPWPWNSSGKTGNLFFQGVTFMTRLDF